MSTKKLQNKILVYGNIFRDYRSQTLVKILLDSGYHVSSICPDFYLKKTFSLFNFLYLIELAIKAYFADVIYLSPMNSRFIKSAIWAAKTFQKKLIVEMYISIYDTFVGDQKILKGKQIKPGSRQAKAMLTKDILALTKSDFIIHTASHELTYWEKLLNIEIAPEKVFIAPNFNVSRLNHRRKFKQDGNLKICWWGTFIPLHGLENILQALKILQANKVKLTCDLFGVDNDLFNTYAEKIKLEQLDDCVSLKKDLSFSDNSLPQYLIDNCDLALGIFGKTDKAYNTVPNKLIEALSMGIPTLTMKSAALKEFFEPETDLWTCENSSESIAESIVAIAEGTAHPVDWEQTRQKVLNTFSVTRYQEVVSQVLDQAINNFEEREISAVQNSVKIYEQKIS
ncbi:MAG: glycosyltransferase [Pleurocapsa sp. MO_192.B19]|nr:glycosyltransferase [Pleurocapsa sp. MO_192.B19]